MEKYLAIYCMSSCKIMIMGGSPGELNEELVTHEKRKKGWRMNCDVGEVTNSWRMSRAHSYSQSRARSPTFSSLQLRHSSFSNPFFASPTSQTLHLIHLAPSDFHLLLYLKKFLSGQRQRFHNDREAEMSVTQWLQSQAADFYDTGI